VIQQNKKIIGETIRQARKKNKLTQNFVANKAKISRNYLSDLENGRYAPSSETLLFLSKILKIDINALIQELNFDKEVS
jgi:transcriptional regulator with XRE-family HTH domain